MDLEKALKKLIYKDPFYGLFLLSLDKQYSEEVPTAAVARNGINCRLLINKDYWNTLDDEEQLFVLRHEVSHIMFKHMFLYEDLSNREIANIAMDCEINQWIDPHKTYLGKYFYPDSIQAPPALGSREYYRLIVNNKTSLKVQYAAGNGNGDSMIDPQSLNGQSVDDHSKMQGDGDTGFDGLTDAERELISHQIDHIAKNTAEQTTKQRGTIPGCFKEYIEGLFKQKSPIFNWKKYFRRLIGTQISIDLKKTRKKESIRFPDSSAVKYRKKSKILVAIDTSGSVNDKELCDFFSEINHILRANVDVDICECDTKIDRIYRYTGKWDGSISGRGGTDFTAPIEYFNEHRDYTTMVYFTDGYAPIPSIRVRNNQIIWVITSGGQHQDYPGRAIYIPNEY